MQDASRVATERSPLGEDWQATSPEADVTAIVVTYNSGRHIAACLQSLRDVGLRLHVVVIDNASSDDTVAVVSTQFPEVELVARDENSGFARAVNLGLLRVRADYVLLLNPDAMLHRGTLEHLVKRMGTAPEVGMLGCRLLQADGSLDHACRRSFPSPANSVRYFLRLDQLPSTGRKDRGYRAEHLPEDGEGPIDAINGAFMLARRKAVQEVGGLDERFWMYGEDLDWCLRFHKAGWLVYYDGTKTATHLKGASSGRHRHGRVNRAFHGAMWRYYRKHLVAENGLHVAAAVGLGIGLRFLQTSLTAALSRQVHLLRRTRG